MDPTLVLTTNVDVDFNLLRRVLVSRLKEDPTFEITKNDANSSIEYNKIYEFPGPIRAILGVNSIQTPQTLDIDYNHFNSKTTSTYAQTILGCTISYALEIVYQSFSNATTQITANIDLDISALGPVAAALRPLLHHFFRKKFDKEREIELSIASTLKQEQPQE